MVISFCAMVCLFVDITLIRFIHFLFFTNKTQMEKHKSTEKLNPSKYPFSFCFIFKVLFFLKFWSFA